MSKFKTVSMQFIPGEYYKTQGHKAGEKNHYNKSGRFVSHDGFGWATESKPSQLLLYVENEKKLAAVRVDPYFKDVVGRMTENRVSKIMDAIPDEVHVEKRVSYYGNEYMAVKDSDMDAWRKVAGLKKKQ